MRLRFLLLLALFAYMLATLFQIARNAGFATDGCTGFWWAEWRWPLIRRCCVDHDLGASDGTLVDCLVAASVPPALAVAGVALMALLRPAYHALKRWLFG